MRLLAGAFLLSASLVASVHGACTCFGGDQTINPTSAPMLLFQNPTSNGASSGTACMADCKYVGHSSKGLRLQLINQNLGDSTLIIKEGSNVVMTITGTTTSFAYNSTVSDVSLEYTGKADANTFLLVMYYNDFLVTPATNAPTTLSPTTPAYTGNFSKNPFLISNDIIIAIDTSGKQANVDQLRKLAASFVTKLSVTVDEHILRQTRLSLHALTGYPGFSPSYRPAWTETADSASSTILNTIAAMGKDNSDYTGIKDYLAATFGTARRHTPKYYILFTAAIPQANGEHQLPPVIDFASTDIHPIVITSGISDTDIQAYFTNQYTDRNKWSQIKYDSTEDAALHQLIDGLLFTPEKTSCQPLVENLRVEFKFGKNQEIPVQIPREYTGPHAAAKTVGSRFVRSIRDPSTPRPTTPWEAATTNYCNFQTTTIELVITGKTDSQEYPFYNFCMRVWYELEPDADYVYLMEGSNSAVTLTGLDVSGASIKLRSPNPKIVFKSDEKAVFDGFYALVHLCNDGEKNPNSPIVV